MARKKTDGHTKFKKQSFSVLIKEDQELSDLRRENSLKTKSQRRDAADWQYHSEVASHVFNNALAQAGRTGLRSSYWPEAFASLAIDPLYAPAILTVGSLEYQVGRPDEAMNLFLSLTKLPEDEDDLSVIIDKAGDFLIDCHDYANALTLYLAAEKSFPNEALYLVGSGYCMGKLGLYGDSVKKHRRANDLEPDNYFHLNDLGYSLLEAGQLDEAERVLKKSISLAPDNYEFPSNNLKELRKRQNRGSR
ncbi:MAG: hypothetical protein HQM16_02535 [Deltaproteobacteria bacterium]|nr:hypothetical protein [Deltaproteobacteria bacterium]